MADYVVDASVICQYFITQIHTEQSTAVVALMLQGDRLHIPEFTLSECVNVFWKHVRFQGLPQSDAEQFTEELLALPFQVTMISHLLPRALQIGLVNQLPIYDSLYIALALELNCPLITVDQRQANAAAVSGVTLKAIADFPPT